MRDFESETVICPAGYVLYKKCVKSNGYTRYMRKAACSRCDQFKRCCSGKMKWKEIDFPEGAACVSCKNWFLYAGGCLAESPKEAEPTAGKERQQDEQRKVLIELVLKKAAEDESFVGELKKLLSDLEKNDTG